MNITMEAEMVIGEGQEQDLLHSEKAKLTV